MKADAVRGILKDHERWYEKAMERRIKELETQLADIHASTRRMSFQQEWYLNGLRNPPGDYVLMRVGPVTTDDLPF